MNNAAKKIHTLCINIDDVKAGDQLMYNGCVYTATSDADVNCAGNWHVDVQSEEKPEKCLFEDDFPYGSVEIIFPLEEIQRVAYEAFKLDWMITHGYTVADLLAKYSDYWGKVESDEEGMIDFWKYLEETGFNGEIWPCFQEFLDCEFKNANLRNQLLAHSRYDYPFLCLLSQIMSEEEAAV